MSRLCRVLLGAGLLVLAGCDPPGKPDPAHRPVPPDQVLDFDTLFGTHCAGCHGAEGKLGPAPPLNDPLFLQLVSQGQLEGIIGEGRASPLPPNEGAPSKIMPAFLNARGGPLTPEQVTALAAGIVKRWKPEGEAPQGVPPYRSPGGLLAGNALAGEQVFVRACASCHGEQGRDGDAGAINTPAVLSLVSDQGLRRFILTGRPDLGMPRYDDSSGRGGDFTPLTSAEIDDLVALLACWRQAGEQ